MLQYKHMLKLAYETAQSGLNESLFTKVKTTIEHSPLAWFILGRRKGRRDFAAADPFKGMLNGGALGRSSSHQSSHANTEDLSPLTDQTIDNFLSHLKINLGTWHQRPLAEELALLRKQQEEQKKHT